MEKPDNKIAQNVYDMIISTLKSQDYKFLQPDNLKVAFQIETDDTPIVFSVVIYAERQLIRMIAGYSITFPKERRINGAIATCSTNCNLVAGGFDFDYETGSVVFRISASFAGSIISPDVFFVYDAQSIQRVRALRQKARSSCQRRTVACRISLSF